VNAHLDVNNRPGWRVGGGVGYSNGGGGGGSPIYRGALLTAANVNELHAIGAGGLGIRSPQHNVEKRFAANILEQVANDHQGQHKAQAGAKLSPLHGDKRNNRKLVVSTSASVSPLRRAMSQKL
jgi:hypothetical protein